MESQYQAMARLYVVTELLLDNILLFANSRDVIVREYCSSWLFIKYK